MKIIPLIEGAFTVDQSKEFIPFDLSKDKLEARSKGSLLVEIQPFLIITSTDLILLDTGLGFTGENGKMQIHNNLSALGINPEDVTKVLISHLHKDHSGGISMPDKQTPSFKNAVYYLNRNEWEHANEKHSLSYHSEDFQSLQKHKKVEFLKGTGFIGEHIEYIFTNAHSPYHQAFKITENNSIAFFGGDVAPQLMQMKNRFKAKYDYDPQKAADLRQQWRQLGESENWKFLFYHDIKYPIYSFRQE